MTRRLQDVPSHIAGERRWRACKIAGVTHPPVRIIEADDKTMAELALLENLQREDLNLIEEANGYKRLMDLGLSMEDVAKKMGFKQTWRIRERLDLLRLHPQYQRLLIDKFITPSQAYELSRLPHDKQHILYDKIRQGRADSYNKLRSLANALLVPQPEQILFGPSPSEGENKIATKYDRLLDNLCRFVRSSFNEDDLSVLKKVVRSSVDVNIEKIELIIGDLQKIKKAMIKAQSVKEAAA